MPEKRIFYTIIFFINVGIFSYILSGLVDLNLPKYYPMLRRFSVTTLEGPAMAFYAKIALTIVIAALLGKIFYLIFPLIEKYFDNSKNYLVGFTQATMLFGIFFFIAEEWHKWGIEKRKLDNGLFFNVEFWFYLILIGLFLGLFFVLWLVHSKYKNVPLRLVEKQDGNSQNQEQQRGQNGY